MTDGPAAQSSSNALGVVDPLRIPGLDWLRRSWRRLPPLAKVFVALTAIDVAIRVLGLWGTFLGLDLAIPITLITAFAPHDLLILLPAMVLARRPDAARATPLVLSGAVAVAVVELASRPLAGLLTAATGDVFVLPITVSTAASVAQGVGWLAIALGLAGLTRHEPRRVIGGLANLVFAGLAAAALVTFFGSLVAPQPELGMPGAEGIYRVSGLLFVIGALAWAFLGRIVVRAADDTRRPLIATRLALVAFGIMAVAAAIEALLSAIVVVQLAFPGVAGMLGGGWAGDALVAGSVLRGLISILATSAVLLAFALGLADESVPVLDDEPARRDGLEQRSA
jgi:hypothetical protein